MKKQAGFTLIELVIVIIILGILAVTAAPKFLNLQDDARYSAAQGVQAALQSSAQLVYSKAALEGKEAASSALPLTGLTGVQVIYGYPTAATISAAVTLEGWSTSGAAGTFVPDNGAGNSCSVVYTQATSAAIFSTKINGCKKP
ncbi:prepilin-type N-terminal cleavage/methylation domain-containing protein [Aeromonas sobria]|uniref:prepilin-type N-terminal cleavage/methylation domain-containing protein n=1 Tax=Aeromonas sobria TaxID=646 RepID=UPI0011175928|nr:prepilin-type N-terminal cleavage/methylation domain-containing protein [Aeromonas sobria]TNH89027.1 MSHA biogenesis protein MshA [Aeromonas sobria]